MASDEGRSGAGKSDAGNSAGWRIATAAAALMVCAALAVHLYPSPQDLTLCAIATLVAGFFLMRAIQSLITLSRLAAEPVQAQVQRVPADAMLALEGTLEHAPIALFRIEGGIEAEIDGGSEPTTNQQGNVPLIVPINTYARRLIAPGRATNPSDLFDKIAAHESGKRKMIVFDTERGQERALVAVNTIVVRGRQQRLAALMTIESELETAALDAWQQLVHVLTHEIMNSLTPVASLSRTAHDLLDEWRTTPDSGADADLATALSAISRRADSLVSFVTSYRSLSNMQPAQTERLHLQDLFTRLSALAAPGWAARGGQAVFSVEPSSLEVMVDPGQLEQALINLLQNAAEATAKQDAATVSVRARLGRGGRLLIEVQDNGPGVPEALIQHIFTPFFSTKSKGSGIGLAMVRQLIHGNGGTVRYVKPTSGGACFVITF